MADLKFHDRSGPYKLEDIAAWGLATINDDDAANVMITDIAPLDLATKETLTFLDNPAYRHQLQECQAAACILHPKNEKYAPDGMVLLFSEDPYLCYARIAQKFYPLPKVNPGISPHAVVHETADIDPSAEIGPFVVIEAGATIGADCSIKSHVVIGQNVAIGAGARIMEMVRVSHAVIGENVTLHPGVKIGQDGFGFAPNPGGHQRVPQIGRVLIGNACNIGADTAIDRGSLQDTAIGEDCWIDNQVQIGHNVVMGRGCIIAAQAGISGSCEIGDYVLIGGQAGFAGHIKIGTGAQIAAQSGVISSVEPGARVSGMPAIPIKEFFRQTAVLRRIVNEKKAKKT